MLSQITQGIAALYTERHNLRAGYARIVVKEDDVFRPSWLP